MEQLFKQIFKGYLLIKNLGILTLYAGVYAIYSCIYKEKSNNVIIRNLLYIGKTDKLPFEKNAIELNGNYEGMEPINVVNRK